MRQSAALGATARGSPVGACGPTLPETLSNAVRCQRPSHSRVAFAQTQLKVNRAYIPLLLKHLFSAGRMAGRQQTVHFSSPLNCTALEKWNMLNQSFSPNIVRCWATFSSVTS